MTLKAEITNILNAKQTIQFINEKFDYKTNNFENQIEQKNSKKDYRNLKTTNNVDEIMFVKVKYGILVSYYGMIELDKQGYVNTATEVDLNDNSLLQQETFKQQLK
jgi:predicted GH43/DUF377 family glycosyl hydrolase